MKRSDLNAKSSFCGRFLAFLFLNDLGRVFGMEASFEKLLEIKNALNAKFLSVRKKWRLFWLPCLPANICCSLDQRERRSLLCRHRHESVRKKVFGQVVIIQPMWDGKEALALMNWCRFGSNAGVFTNNLAQKMEARRLPFLFLKCTYVKVWIVADSLW